MQHWVIRRSSCEALARVPFIVELLSRSISEAVFHSFSPQAHAYGIHCQTGSSNCYQCLYISTNLAHPNARKRWPYNGGCCCTLGWNKPNNPRDLSHEINETNNAIGRADDWEGSQRSRLPEPINYYTLHSSLDVSYLHFPSQYWDGKRLSISYIWLFIYQDSILSITDVLILLLRPFNHPLSPTKLFHPYFFVLLWNFHQLWQFRVNFSKFSHLSINS